MFFTSAVGPTIRLVPGGGGGLKTASIAPTLVVKLYSIGGWFGCDQLITNGSGKIFWQDVTMAYNITMSAVGLFITIDNQVTSGIIIYIWTGQNIVNHNILTDSSRYQNLNLLVSIADQWLLSTKFESISKYLCSRQCYQIFCYEMNWLSLCNSPELWRQLESYTIQSWLIQLEITQQHYFSDLIRGELE